MTIDPRAARRHRAEAIARRVPPAATDTWDEHVTLIDTVLAHAVDRIRREEIHWIADALDEVGAHPEAAFTRGLLDCDEVGGPRLDPPTEPLAVVVPLRRVR